MRVVIVPRGATSDQVLDRLSAWSAAGLLEPFCWWPVDAGAGSAIVQRIDRGSSREMGLGPALEGTDLSDVAVVAFYAAGAGETFDPGFEAAVDRCMDAVVDVVPPDFERPTECTMVVAPGRIAQPVPRTLFQARWASNVYIAPEDRIDPKQPNTLVADAERFPSHAAHALASVADLWVRRGSEAPGVVEELKVTQAMQVPDPVRVVRCFSRVVDFGFLADHLAASVFQTSDAWPNPDMTRFDRIADPAPVIPSLVEDYIAKHGAVLGLSPFEPIRLDPPPKLGLLEALKAVVKELIARLRNKPFDWAERQAARLHDRVAKLIESAAPDDMDLRVRLWDEQPEGARNLRELSRYLDKPRPEPDPAVAPTWTDLRGLALGLVDGTPLPEQVSQAPLTRGPLRAVVTDPRSIVPDPERRPPASERLPDPRACDPLNLDSRFLVGPPPDGVDPDEWSAPHRGTPVWMVGAEIAGALRTAEAIASQEPEDPPPLPALPKKSRRLRRTALFATILVAVGGYFAWTELALLPRLGAFLALAFVWLLLMAMAARRALRRERGHSRKALERELGILNAALLRGRRAGDVIRLRRRYGEYLDWAEIIGWFVHRPWVGEPLRHIDLPGTLDERALPAAFRVAVASSPAERVEQLANAARTRLFRSSWLTGLYAGVDAGIWADAGWTDGAADRPNPAGDTSEDPQSLRRRFLKAVQRGDHRHLRDNDLAEGLLDFVNQLPLDHAAHTVTTSDASSGAQALPPSVAWFAPPKNLAELSRRLRPVVVRIIAGPIRGSGMIVDGTGLVVTSLHVVDNASELAVEFPDGTVAEAEVVAASAAADLALVSSTLPEGVAVASLAPDTAGLAQGDPVITLGHPSALRGQPTLAWGLVTATDRRIVVEGLSEEVTVLQATYESAGGASGSPVFDLDGRVVGVHTAGAWDPDDPKASYLSSASPIEAVHRLLAAKRGASATAGAGPRSGSAGRAARSAAPERTPSAFLGELFDVPERIALLRQHWSSRNDAYVVERAVPTVPGLTGALGPISSGARFLEPLRVIVHRVDLTRRVSPTDLSSCVDESPEPEDDALADIILE